MHNSADIIDDRISSQFRTSTFSNYKRTRVRDELKLSWSKDPTIEVLEDCCYWSAELVCAGHYLDVWESVLSFYSRSIHLANPKLAIYLAMKYDHFANALTQDYLATELDGRNCPDVRQTIAEVVCVLSLSPKLPGGEIEAVKLNPTNEMNFSILSNKLAAPHDQFAGAAFQKDDPHELFVAMNEFAFILQSDATPTSAAWYWIEWTLEFDVYMKKRNQQLQIARRLKVAADIKYQRDVVWLIWDVLFHSVSTRHQSTSSLPLLIRILEALQKLFSIRYGAATAKRRKFILYCAASMVMERPNMDTLIVGKTERDIICREILDKLDENVYALIKARPQSAAAAAIADGNYATATATTTTHTSPKVLTALEKSIFKLKTLYQIENNSSNKR